MSHETPKSDTPRTHTIKPRSTKGSGDGQWKKWAAGGAAAVVLLGGGYFLVKNLNQNDSRSELAYNESIPLDEATTSADESSRNTVETAASTESATPAAAPARRRQAAASTAADPEVPEQIVGVSPASATTSDEDEIIVPGIRGPQWSRAPSARRLSTAYPERALERGREGEASVSCTVEQSGSLDCVRVSETPANSGFGTAALRVARMYRHAPERWNGSSAVGTPVNLRVMFRLADEEDRRRT